ncbi:(2Fe-2S)-binding protein [Nocardia sp. NPDC050406]|uniref:(2Fe-2S)-binding protein n=1 Tax=Nocardia sp. NPDC050406 TaxID=3364318 RepID=UPI0037A453C6
MTAGLVPASELLRPEWLAERIADMGISWGTSDSRVAGTLWWCMAASSLVTPIVTAYATGAPAPAADLAHLACEIRPDGGVERVLPLRDTDLPIPDEVTEPLVGLPLDAAADTSHVDSAGHALRHTLSQVIPVVAEVSGAGVAALWAIVADAIGNRALDAGAQEAGARLARDVAGRLPVPRFTDIGPRTFVRRISCCLVFEVPGCEMCTSCPKRPAAQREALLTELAARG